jgi:hypothetical protein
VKPVLSQRNLQFTESPTCFDQRAFTQNFGAYDMDIRGVVYLVRAQRSDKGWIHYRTCDLHEAQSVARAFGAAVTIASEL